MSERQDGNRTYVYANRKHPFYNDLVSLVRKSSGLAESIADVLTDERIQIAFVFGSLAASTEVLQSDIDLMVIGDLGLRDVVRQLSGLTERFGREINPHVFGAAEFCQRLKRGDHFVSTVVTEPKLFVIGGENELERMAD